ncbi:hypothetical protein ACIGHG_00540 [Bacillus sp. NPDC077411]|uniref:hypothetical protein n=1 Tax=Bacillus sp. NPDC077411 TaxID=3363947 RepID=UPI0037C8EB68
MQIDLMKRVIELEQRIMNLEKKLEEKQPRKIPPIRLLGICIIGPLITGVCALVVLLMSYMNL